MLDPGRSITCITAGQQEAQGYYDEEGNWVPYDTYNGYYDQGYQGYYDESGNWVDTSVYSDMTQATWS
jgi:hypothetical protein